MPLHKTSLIPAHLIDPDAVRSTVVAYATPDVNNGMYKRVLCQLVWPVCFVFLIIATPVILTPPYFMVPDDDAPIGSLDSFKAFAAKWFLYVPIAFIVLGLCTWLSAARNNIQRLRSTVFVLTTRELVVFVRGRIECACSQGAPTKSIPLENITDASTNQCGICGPIGGYQQDLLCVDTASSKPGHHEAMIFGFDGIPEFMNLILAQRDAAKADFGGLHGRLAPTLLGEQSGAEKLRELGDLVNQGILTQQEFDSQKAKILATMV